MSSSIKNSIFIFILLATFVSSSSYNTTQESPIEKRYKKWLTRYGNLRPSNLSNMDLKKRFEIYKDNVQFIDKFNSENHSFTLIDNKFADMTPKEFKAKFLNEKAGNHTHLKRGSYRNHLNISQETSCPASWNWVAKGVVGPVKNQAQCGSCWAFSAVAAVESLMHLKTGKQLSLSEQELVDCDTASYNKGCKGGFDDVAFRYIAKNGLASSNDYPYIGADGKCKSNIKKSATIYGYGKVKSGNENLLACFVANRPISVSLHVDDRVFMSYHQGVYYCTKCGYHETNHVVLVVGYGRDKSTGSDYWIIKNSYGKNWGYNGYFFLRRNACAGIGVCGITQAPCYPI